MRARRGRGRYRSRRSQRDFIRSVGHVDQLALGAQQDKPAGSVSVADGALEIFVVLGGLVDLAAEGKRLEKELAKAEKELAGTKRTLSNEGFVAKAAPEGHPEEARPCRGAGAVHRAAPCPDCRPGVTWHGSLVPGVCLGPRRLMPPRAFLSPCKIRLFRCG